MHASNVPYDTCTPLYVFSSSITGIDGNDDDNHSPDPSGRETELHPSSSHPSSPPPSRPLMTDEISFFSPDRDSQPGRAAAAAAAPAGFGAGFGVGVEQLIDHNR